MKLIRFERILDNMKTPFTLHIKELNGDYKEVAKRGELINREFKERFKNKGHPGFYVEIDVAKTGSEEEVHSKQKQINEEEHKRYLDKKDEYHSISKAMFQVGEEINFSLFEQKGMVIAPLVETTQNKFVKVPPAVKSVYSLLISKADIPVFKHFLNESTKKKISNGDNSMVSVVVKEASKINIRNFISKPLERENIVEVVNSTSDIVRLIKQSNGKSMRELMVLRAADTHLYNHCLNVSVLASSVAQDLMLTTSEMEALALAAMLHDVGKSQLPKSVLYKPSQLSAEEFVKWKQHVNAGIVVAQNNNLPQEAILAVKQHHEKLSGSGYPFGLKGLQISKLGRILAIVDAYDALVTPRIGKTALKSFDVCNILMNDAKKGDLDLEFVKSFIKVLNK